MASPLRCANPLCFFQVHSLGRFGGYCCRCCFTAEQTDKSSHGRSEPLPPPLRSRDHEVSRLVDAPSDDLRLHLVVEVHVGSSVLYCVLCVDAKIDVFSRAATLLMQATGHSSSSSSIQRVDIL